MRRKLACGTDFSLILSLLSLLVVCGVRKCTGQQVQPTLIPADPKRISKWNPLKALTADPETPAGLLAYPAHIGEDGAKVADNFLVIRHIGPGKSLDTDSTLRYRPFSGATLFNPGISPDGRYVAFNFGEYAGLGSEYKLLIWDRKSKKLLSGPDDVLRDWDHYWSPDSTRIAYVHGGDASGHPLPGLESIPESEAIRLCVFDLKTGKSVVVVKADAAVSMAWSPGGTLLYTAPSSDGRSLSIYETDARGGPPHELAPHGRNPIPSPDGRWLAFLGEMPPDAKGDDRAAKRFDSAPGLYVLDRRSGKRVRVRAGLKGIGAMWTPDSRSLVTVEETYRRLDKVRGEGRAVVSRVEIGTLQRRQFALLTATDVKYRPTAYPEDEHQFRPMGVSPDGTWACFKTVEAVEVIQNSYLTHRSLLGVNLKTGKTLRLAQTESFWGSSLEFDWRFDPLPAPHKSSR